MDSVDFLKNYKFDDESEAPFHFDIQNVFELLDKLKRQEAAISLDSSNTLRNKMVNTPVLPSDHVERTAPTLAPPGHTEEPTNTSRPPPSDPGEHPTATSALQEDSKKLSTTPAASNHDHTGGTQSNVEGEKDSENHVMTMKPLSTSTTEDYRAALNRFWESTDYNNMNDYVKKLEESIKRYNVLDGTFRGMYSPYNRPVYSQTEPPPPPPPPPTIPTYHYHAHAPQPPARDNWRDHRDTPIVKHKYEMSQHGLQTWHIVIIVAILVAALVSYACRVSSKRSTAPRSRRRRSGSAQERALPVASAPAGDQLYAAPTSHLVAGAGAGVPTPRDVDPHLQLQEVSVERIGFVLPDAAPPSRPDTPPPPYPGPPLRQSAADDRHRKSVEPPPPYYTAITKPC